MNAAYSLGELAASVQRWCDDHQVHPANGQAAEVLSERTIRYYRTLGLLDAPIGGNAKSFAEKHRLQLLAIRVYQAQGLPLRLIRERLYGQTEKSLRQLTHPESLRQELPPRDPLAGIPGLQQWTVAPVGDEFLVVSRRGRCLRPELLGRIRRILDEDGGPLTPGATPSRRKHDDSGNA